MKISAKFSHLVLFGLVLVFALVHTQAAKAQKASQKIKFSDYCSIAQSPERFAGKAIRTRALLTYSTVMRVDGGDSFLYSSACNGGDNFATLDFSEQETPDKSSEVFKKLPQERNFIFEVVIIGEFVNSLIPNFGHLSWAINEFKVHEIRSIHQVTSRDGFAKPNLKADTPRTDSGNYLQWLNSEILFYFLGSPAPKIERYFDANLVITDPSGNTFGLNALNEVIRGNIFDAPAAVSEKFVKGPVAVKRGGKIVTSGEAGFTLNSGEKKALDYECIFRQSKSEFILEKITFSNKK